MNPSLCKKQKSVLPHTILTLCFLSAQFFVFQEMSFANDGALDDIVSVSLETAPTRVERIVNGVMPPSTEFSPQAIDVYQSTLNEGARLIVSHPILTGPQMNLPYWGSLLKLSESTSLGTLIHRSFARAVLYQHLTLIQNSTVNRRILSDSIGASLNQAALRVHDSQLLGSAELGEQDSHTC